MSEPNPIEGLEPTPVAAETTRRAASVQLRRQGEGQPEAGLMDPAHQSLADALRITLRLVQLTMLVLAGFFVFSGARTIREGESGVRLLFGEVQAEDLKPGFQFSWPFPIGDLIKVQTGNQVMNLDTAFWPYLTEQQRSMPIEQVTASSSLDPARDGSLITADGNLVHASWVVTYRRLPESASKYVRNIRPDSEEDIIRSAVMRGVVHAVAQYDIDEVLKEAGGGTVAAQARAIAQSQLDRIEAGIEIESLDLNGIMPPLNARSAFYSVQGAEATASKARSDARSEAEQLLIDAAGRVYRELLVLIDDSFEPVVNRHEARRDAYLELINQAHQRGEIDEEQIEQLAELGDRAESAIAGVLDAESRGEDASALRAQRDELVGRIGEMLPGTGDLLAERGELRLERSQVLSSIHEMIESARAGGEVANLINDAELYRDAEVSRRQTDLATYQARLIQFRRNSRVTLHNDWADALSAFINRESVQVMFAPPDTQLLEVMINADPEYARRQEQAAKQRILEETREEREAQRARERYRTNTNAVEMDGG